MQQGNSREAYSFSATQEIFCILWKTNVHYRVHNSPLIIPILNQIDKFHISPTYLFTIYFNITLPSTARSANNSFSFMFHHRKPLRTPLTPHTHMLKPHTANFKSRHIILPWIIYIQFQSPKTMPFISILVLSYHTLLQLPKGVQVTLLFPAPGIVLMATAKSQWLYELNNTKWLSDTTTYILAQCLQHQTISHWFL